VALHPGEEPHVTVDREIDPLVERFPRAACFAVDMPIGLPRAPDTVRSCDLRARELLGPRRNSVFLTPRQEVLYAATYKEANRVAARLPGGRRISRQAYALAATVKAVERLAERDERVIEVHPEVSFRELIGEPVEWAKATWNGQSLRRSSLASEGIRLPPALPPETGGVPAADVLDAAAAAWTARRYAAGEARSLPEGTRPGSRQVIWY
jgi:predicted RNase H-like nuclease